MKKLLTLFIILVMISSVSAIEILSSSQIDFEVNNDIYNGPAFVVAGVENGGNDVITWTINNFQDEVDEGYEFTKSGTITSDFKPEGWTYPVQTIGTEYTPLKVGDSTWFLTSGQASEWCENLGGDYYHTTWNLFEYACIKWNPTGYFLRLEPGEYKYDVDYILDVQGVGSDTLTLTETSRTGGDILGRRNFFQANILTNGVGYRADPDINNRMSLFYNLQTGSFQILDPDPEINEVGFNAVRSVYPDCVLTFGVGDFTQNCIDEWNVRKTSFLSSNSNFIFGVDTDDVRMTSSGLGTGSVLFDDGEIYRNPIVTLTIDADRIGVRRVFGEGEIVNVDYPENMQVGYSYPISIEVKNIGEANMDASLNFDCDTYSLTGISQRFTLEEGESRVETGRIIYSGAVDGCEFSSCKLTFGNANSVFDDSYTFSSKVCQASECEQEGATICFGNVIRRCSNIQGVLQYETIKTCTNQCSQETSSNAVCKDNSDPVCGDGICEAPEREGERLYCPADCDEVPPVCGDGICDGRERSGGEYECVEGKQQPWDCPKENVTPTDYTLIIFGIIGALILGGALYLRLKKEGYFK